MPAIILLAVWKNFGYATILLVAGLQAIPESLYEAARLEGAGWWQLFRKITLPMLSPTLLFLGVLTTIGYFQFFAEPYVMTGGGGPLNATPPSASSQGRPVVEHGLAPPPSRSSSSSSCSV
jgi:multiple sugar transport system permease protein